MAKSTAALCLLALVALSFVADSNAVFCRYSSYQLDGKVILNLKKVFIKKCGFKVKLSGKPKNNKEIVLSKVFTEDPKTKKAKRCNSIIQTVIDEATWNTFKACQDLQKQWPILFAKRPQCAKFQKNLTC